MRPREVRARDNESYGRGGAEKGEDATGDRTNIATFAGKFDLGLIR
jgi:hypothetical protein